MPVGGDYESPRKDLSSKAPSLSPLLDNGSKTSLISRVRRSLSTASSPNNSNHQKQHPIQGTIRRQMSSTLAGPRYLYSHVVCVVSLQHLTRQGLWLHVIIVIAGWQTPSLIAPRAPATWCMRHFSNKMKNPCRKQHHSKPYVSNPGNSIVAVSPLLL